MKKKMISMVALVLALTMLFGMNAFAAKSVSAKDPSVTTQVMQNFADQFKAWYTEDPTETYRVLPESVENYDSAVDAAAKLLPGSKVLGVVNLTITDVSAEQMTAGWSVTMKAPGIAATKEYVILQFINNKWEVLETKNNGDGTLTAIFHSTAPVIAIVEKSAGVESPKTGQESNLAMILTMTALCGIAVFSFKKQTEFN